MIALALAGFAVVVARTAWVCDDAYITLRVVENLAQGHGLRWNTQDRVLVSTHPLWLLLLGPLRIASGDVYLTTLATSASCALLAVGLLMRQAASWTLAVALVLILTSSRAFVDYSTSGLENPLAYVLLAAFVVPMTSAPTVPNSFWLSLTASCLMTTRHDFALLVAPVLLSRWWATRNVRHTFAVMLGQLPLLAWLGFATWYFGSPWPMPSHAKLFATGIPLTEVLVQGSHYYGATWRNDWVTLPMIALGLTAGLHGASTRALAIGTLLYLGYVLRIGGDFMLSRFFAVPVFVAALCAARSARLALRPVAVGLGVAGTALGLMTPHPTWVSDGEYVGQGSVGPGIFDERGVYYPSLGLLSADRAPPAWAAAAAALPSATLEQPAITVQYAVGVAGFALGGHGHLVDPLLCDPLLSRLPAAKPAEWRIGHATRNIPAGYLQSLARGRNEIAHPALARYYDAVRELAQGDLWSPSRLRTIWAFACGDYDHLRAEYLATDYFALQPTRVHIDQLPQVAECTPWFAPGVVGVSAGGVAVDLGAVHHEAELRMSLHSQGHYHIEFHLAGRAVARTIVASDPGLRRGMGLCTVRVPTAAQTEGYDELRVHHDLGGSIDHVGALAQVLLR